MTDIWNLATYVAVFAFVIALIGVAAWLLKSMLYGNSSSGGGLLRRGERRLGVVEAASVDGRRKLLLIRRDATEHLIMIGGPVDMLIESGIERPSAPNGISNDSKAARQSKDKRDVQISHDLGVIERE